MCPTGKSDSVRVVPCVRACVRAKLRAGARQVVGPLLGRGNRNFPPRACVRACVRAGGRALPGVSGPCTAKSPARPQNRCMLLLKTWGAFPTMDLGAGPLSSAKQPWLNPAAAALGPPVPLGPGAGAPPVPKGPGAGPPGENHINLVKNP